MASFKICSNCGAQNDPADQFCVDCGYSISAIPVTEETDPFTKTAEETTLPLSPVVDEPAGKACPKCGHLNPDYSRFCEECGSTIAAPVSESESVPVPVPVFEPESVPVPVPVFEPESVPVPVPVFEPTPAPVSEAPRPRVREVPDIPSIMRPMTNDDMKR